MGANRFFFGGGGEKKKKFPPFFGRERPRSILNPILGRRSTQFHKREVPTKGQNDDCIKRENILASL